jgi:hypothetical protein
MKLPGFLQFIFGCRHRHVSRVFTIKLRTYRVCFDCGREFELPSAHAPGRSGGAGNPRSSTNPVLRPEGSAPRFGRTPPQA